MDITFQKSLKKDCQNFDKQTSSAILSAVEEYKQYTKQQKEASTMH